jgi:hypothetical protein
MGGARLSRPRQFLDEQQRRGTSKNEALTPVTAVTSFESMQGNNRGDLPREPQTNPLRKKALAEDRG